MKEKDVEILLKNNLFIKVRTNRIIERDNTIEMFFIKIDEIIYYTIKALYR